MYVLAIITINIVNANLVSKQMLNIIRSWQTWRLAPGVGIPGQAVRAVGQCVGMSRPTEHS